MSTKVYRAIGLMSGSSLDGLDIAYCEFHILDKNLTNWQILQAETIEFSADWQEKSRLRGRVRTKATLPLPMALCPSWSWISPAWYRLLT